MNKRNENFAAVLAYLKDRGDIETQKDLAELMGVSQDTISRILKGGSVSESTITKLHAATKGLFNLQWMHGQSDVMLSAEAMAARQPSPTPPDTTAAMLAAKDETIAALRSQLSDKDRLIAEKDARIADLQQHIADLRRQLTEKKGLTKTGRSRSERAEQGIASQHAGE